MVCGPSLYHCTFRLVVTFPFQILPSLTTMTYSHSCKGNVQNPWINKSVKLPSSFDTAEQFRWTEILAYQLNTD